MKKVVIKKNGKKIKQFSSPENMLQKYFQFAFDMAGGMYNGKDKFTVEIEEPEIIADKGQSRIDDYAKKYNLNPNVVFYEDIKKRK